MGSEHTSSSRRAGLEGVLGGMILYVMRTFFALRHIGRVECVTLQVPWSHSRGGDKNEVDEGRVGLYFLGERRLIVLAEAALGVATLVGGTSTTIVVPPGDSPAGRASSAMLAVLLPENIQIGAVLKTGRIQPGFSRVVVMADGSCLIE